MKGDTMTTDFTGYAFPVIRSRFAGPTDTRGSRYNASLRRGDETDRATVRYDHALSSGENARRAAVAVWEKHQKRMTATTGIDDSATARVFIPGDAPDGYVFVVVPAYFFTGDKS